MKDIFFKLMFNILKNFMNFIMIYHFYLGKLVANLHDKIDYVADIRNLKQTLNPGLVSKKFYNVIYLIKMFG